MLLSTVSGEVSLRKLQLNRDVDVLKEQAEELSGGKVV